MVITIDGPAGTGKSSVAHAVVTLTSADPRRGGTAQSASTDADGRFELAGGPQGNRDGKGADVRFFPIGAMTVAADGSLLLTSGPTIRQVLADGREEVVSDHAARLMATTPTSTSAPSTFRISSQ